MRAAALVPIQAARQEDAEGAEKSLFIVLKLKDKVTVLDNCMMVMMRVMIDTLVLDDDDDDR